MAALEPGALLPSLSLFDENGERTGLPRGETLYAFFKTTCPTCELAWPYLDRIRQLGRQAFPVLAVSQDPPADTAAFNGRLGVSIPTLYDPSPWKASDALGLESVPTFVLVDGEGRIRETAVGFQKHVLERFGDLAAARAGGSGSHATVFRAGESVPALKPG